MTQTIVLLSGWKDSGKDYVADLLVDQFLFHKTSFAKPIKDFVSTLYNIPRPLLDTQDGKRTVIQTSGLVRTYRDLLIYYGEKERNINNNHWAGLVADEISGSPLDNFVISDWRFPHEFTHLQSLFPNARIITIRIHRLLINLCSDNTETSLDSFPFDYVLDNTSDNNENTLIQDLRNFLGYHSFVIR